MLIFTTLLVFSLATVLIADRSESQSLLLQLREKSLSSPQCGTGWQEKYKTMHQDIRNEKLPTRYLVVAHDGQGANDRLTSIITAFYAALISDRALFLVTYLAFDTPIINVELNDNWKHRMVAKPPAQVSFPNMEKIYFRDSDPIFHPRNNNKSLDLLLGDTEIIWFNSNRGYSYHLIKDSPYGAKLREYGINPVYSVHCAFHYIFRPNDDLLEMSAPITQPFLDKSTIKIGIQIRTGDDHMWEDTKLTVNSSKYYENFFNCAKHLEETRIAKEHPGKKVLWYFISDSLDLKRDAVSKFGEGKVFANTEHRPVHTGTGGHEKGGKALKLLFAEQISFSLCDYFIVSHDSHVGRLAIWLSEYGASRTNTYFEHRDFALDANEPICKHIGNEYLLAELGAGI